jgi:predicted RNA-binding Zn-ribbon protein involved in translation (DUF1610 family)
MDCYLESDIVVPCKDCHIHMMIIDEKNLVYKCPSCGVVREL